MTFLHVFYTLRSCRSVFWWLAVPWWARNEISILLVFLLLHCALPWQSLIMSVVMWWSHGNHAGNLAVSGRVELQNLPLLLEIPFMSLLANFSSFDSFAMFQYWSAPMRMSTTRFSSRLRSDKAISFKRHDSSLQIGLLDNSVVNRSLVQHGP